MSLAIVCLAALSATGPVAACDACRRLGAATNRVHHIGGDHLDDALTISSPPTGYEGPSAEFMLQGGQWAQAGGPGSLLTLTYSYQNMFDGALRGPDNIPLPASLIRTSIEQALGLWAAVAPLRFVEVQDDGLSYEMGSTMFGQIRFRHVYINGPDIPGQQPIAKAQAYFPFNGAPYAGDVEFDHSDPWQEFGTLPTPDILGAAVHEIGHSLGLGHTNVVGANMYWIFRRSPGLGTGLLHADDIAGIRAIYGSGQGSVVPLIIPEPTTWIMVMLGAIALLTVNRVVFDHRGRPR